MGPPTAAAVRGWKPGAGHHGAVTGPSGPHHVFTFAAKGSGDRVPRPREAVPFTERYSTGALAGVRRSGRGLRGRRNLVGSVSGGLPTSLTLPSELQ